MRKFLLLCSLAALAFVAIGCGDDDAPATDSGVADSGPADLGPRDMNPPPRRDMGPVDPCVAADAAEALASFDCNGIVPPGAANALFGACTEDVAVGDAGVRRQGSCTAGDECFLQVPGTPSTAFCIQDCTGPGGNYAQTADCPEGSRCLTAFGSDTDGFCIPSCETDADCASGFCDPTDGSCYFAAPVPDVDGGTPVDGGPPGDAGSATDAGPADVDAGPADIDAGPAAVDAGPG